MAAGRPKRAHRHALVRPEDGSSSTWKLDGWPFAKHEAAIPHDTVGYAQPPLTLDAFAEYFGFELDVSERLRRATLL